MDEIDGNWLSIDERENAINNLEMIRYFLQNLDDPIRWKWAIIALHQTLYSFAICATTPTDSRWSLENPEDLDSRLINIGEALKRAKKTDWIRSRDWVPLETSTDEDKAIKRITKEFRNGFVHFRPQSWAIEVSGMPKLFQHTLRVIKHLALYSNNIIYGSEDVRVHVLTEIDLLNEELVRLSSA